MREKILVDGRSAMTGRRAIITEGPMPDVDIASLTGKPQDPQSWWEWLLAYFGWR